MSDTTTTTDPTVTDPTVTDPTVTDPTVTDPTFTDPTFTDPTFTDPTFTDPTFTDPTVTDPTVTDPTVTDPTTSTPTIQSSIASEIVTKWSITNMKVVKQTPTFQNLAIVASYKYSGTYTDPTTGKVYESSVSGNIDLQEPTDTTNYIPYENLTEDIVIGWIIPQINVAYLNSYIIKDITNQISPPEIYDGLPW